VSDASNNSATNTPLWKLGSFRLGRKGRLVAAGGCVVLLCILTVGLYFVDQRWPYRYRNVKPVLESVFASKLTIDHYHRTYFPHPGFVATEMTLRRNTAPNLPPVGSTQELVVQGRWIDLLLLRNRVWLVDVTGLHVVIPPVRSEANREDFPPDASSDFAGPSTAVQLFVMHDAVLDILRTNGGRYTFPIHEVRIGNLQAGKAVSYSIDMMTPRPTGHIQANGSFGPLLPKNLGGTTLSGTFTYTQVDFKSIGGMSGMMTSQGKFLGSIDAIQVSATSVIPDFAVGRGKQTQVTVVSQGTVNGLNRDIVLHRVETRTGATLIEASGTIMGAPKVTDLDITVTKGRAEDLLRPFAHEDVPIIGSVWLKTHAHIDAAENAKTFLERLKMDGSFDVPAEQITDRHTEQSLSRFSQRAQADPSAKNEEQVTGAANDVVSSIKGPAIVREGMVTTRGLEFIVPGASAHLHGTYNLKGGAVNLTGDLRMQNDISHVTTGFKSALLKPFAPFFKKKKAGAVVPIAITGRPGAYKVGQDLLHDK